MKICMSNYKFLLFVLSSLSQADMAVVLRLQGLNIEAGPEDIRRFFHGLPIPEGGVHITGGKMGEAFIIFSSKRAGQLAMLHSGEQLKGSVVTLYKCSRAEFEQEMRTHLKLKCVPTVSEPASSAAQLFATALQLAKALGLGLQANARTSRARSPPVGTPRVKSVPESGKMKESPIADQASPVNNQVTGIEATRPRVEGKPGEAREVRSCKPGYLRLYGVPRTITKEDVCLFLEGLNVEDVITDTLQGPESYCLVKVASSEEAEEGLKYSCGSNDIRVDVRTAHERLWEDAMKCRENSSCSTVSEQDRFSLDEHLHMNYPAKRPCSVWGSPPKRHRSLSQSFDTEYCVMVKNLPKNITKSRIRALFSCPDIPDDKILFLQNKQTQEIFTAFIIFTEPKKYTVAMNMSGSVVCSQEIDVSSVTKEKMKDLMHASRFSDSERSPSRCTQALSCIYARNFPAAVRKTEVKDFFKVYNISEEDIELLVDKRGNGIGEAVVQFGCEERAKEARSLHRELFGRGQILLTCISTQQMEDILHKTL